jgi:hypothetical protein
MAPLTLAIPEPATSSMHAYRVFERKNLCGTGRDSEYERLAKLQRMGEFADRQAKRNEFMKRPSDPVAKQLSGTAKLGPALVVRGMLTNALRYHQAGQLSEAEQIYRQILAINDKHSDGLHLLGVIAYQGGRHEGVRILL